MKRIAMMVALILIVNSISIYGQQDKTKQPHRFMSKLNLTDEQKKDVEKIHFDAAKQTVTQKAKLETARIELRQLLKADNPDKSAIEKKINEMTDLNAQLRLIKIDSWFAINKLLTSDQQKTWKKFLEFGSNQRHHMGMRNKRENHPMPGWQEAPPLPK